METASQSTTSSRSIYLKFFGGLAVCILLSGVPNNFKFWETVDIGFHDLYIEVHPWVLAVFFYVFLVFFLALIVSVRSRFKYRRTTRFLLLHNTLCILLTAYILYVVYAMISIEAIALLFPRLFNGMIKAESTSVGLNQIAIGVEIFLVVLIVGELLIIRRLRRLKKLNK